MGYANGVEGPGLEKFGSCFRLLLALPQLSRCLPLLAEGAGEELDGAGCLLALLPEGCNDECQCNLQSWVMKPPRFVFPSGWMAIMEQIFKFAWWGSKNCDCNYDLNISLCRKLLPSHDCGGFLMTNMDSRKQLNGAKLQQYLCAPSIRWTEPALGAMFRQSHNRCKPICSSNKNFLSRLQLLPPCPKLCLTAPKIISPSSHSNLIRRQGKPTWIWRVAPLQPPAPLAIGPFPGSARPFRPPRSLFAGSPGPISARVPELLTAKRYEMVRTAWK